MSLLVRSPVESPVRSKTPELGEGSESPSFMSSLPSTVIFPSPLTSDAALSPTRVTSPPASSTRVASAARPILPRTPASVGARAAWVGLYVAKALLILVTFGIAYALLSGTQDMQKQLRDGIASKSFQVLRAKFPQDPNASPQKAALLQLIHSGKNFKDLQKFYEKFDEIVLSPDYQTNSELQEFMEELSLTLVTGIDASDVYRKFGAMWLEGYSPTPTPEQQEHVGWFIGRAMAVNNRLPLDHRTEPFIDMLRCLSSSDGMATFSSDSEIGKTTVRKLKEWDGLFEYALHESPHAKRAFHSNGALFMVWNPDVAFESIRANQSGPGHHSIADCNPMSVRPIPGSPGVVMGSGPGTLDPVMQVYFNACKKRELPHTEISLQLGNRAEKERAAAFEAVADGETVRFAATSMDDPVWKMKDDALLSLVDRPEAFISAYVARMSGTRSQHTRIASEEAKVIFEAAQKDNPFWKKMAQSKQGRERLGRMMQFGVQAFIALHEIRELQGAVADTDRVGMIRIVCKQMIDRGATLSEAAMLFHILTPET